MLQHLVLSPRDHHGPERQFKASTVLAKPMAVNQELCAHSELMGAWLPTYDIKKTQ